METKLSKIMVWTKYGMENFRTAKKHDIAEMLWWQTIQFVMVCGQKNMQLFTYLSEYSNHNNAKTWQPKNALVRKEHFPHKLEN